MPGNIQTQLGMNFLENILQGGRDSHPGLDRETEPMGLALSVIRVLAENNDLYFPQRRMREGIENILTRGKDTLALLFLPTQKLA